MNNHKRGVRRPAGLPSHQVKQERVPRRRPARTVMTGLGIVAVAVTVSACGSNKKATPSASKPAATFSGAPVTVYVSVPIKNAIGDLSDVPAAARAAAAAINSRGGLDGHEVKIATCNDSDPNAEVACARQAKASNALAFVGSTFVLNPQASEQILADASIPQVAPEATNTVEYSMPNNFLIDGAVFGYFTCGPQAAQTVKQTKIGFLAQDYPVQKQLGAILGKSAQAQKFDFTGGVYVPASQTDLSSAVAQITGSGAKVVVSGLTPTLVPAYLQALTATGAQVTTCLVPTSFRIDDLAKLGGGENVYVASGLPAPTASSSNPLIKEFLKDMAAEKNSGDADADITQRQPINALRAWLGMHIIEETAKSVHGSLTGATLMAALSKQKVDLGGDIAPPLDFSKPQASKPFARVFNDEVRLLKWDSSKKELMPTTAQPVHVLPLLGG